MEMMLRILGQLVFILVLKRILLSRVEKEGIQVW